MLYLGSESEVLLAFGSDLITLTVPRAEAAEVGRSVYLHLPSEHLRVWARESGLGEEPEAEPMAPLAGVSPLPLRL